MGTRKHFYQNTDNNTNSNDHDIVLSGSLSTAIRTCVFYNSHELSKNHKLVQNQKGEGGGGKKQDKCV